MNVRNDVVKEFETYVLFGRISSAMNQQWLSYSFISIREPIGPNLSSDMLLSVSFDYFW